MSRQATFSSASIPALAVIHRPVAVNVKFDGRHYFPRDFTGSRRFINIIRCTAFTSLV